MDGRGEETERQRGRLVDCRTTSEEREERRGVERSGEERRGEVSDEWVWVWERTSGRDRETRYLKMRR